MENCAKTCRKCEEKIGSVQDACSLCCSDCYKICEFLIGTYINNSLLDISLFDVCINSCYLCIIECKKHVDNDKIYRECISACNNCIAECNAIKMKIMDD